jgi:hypothetical protein
MWLTSSRQIDLFCVPASMSLPLMRVAAIPNLCDRSGAMSSLWSGQTHLIFGIGPTGCVTTSQLLKLCYVYAPYKPLENLDAIALGDSFARAE